MRISANQQKVNDRKAEILRLIAIQGMSCNKLYPLVNGTEPTLTIDTLRITLYAMCSNGFLRKNTTLSNVPNAIYMLPWQETEDEAARKSGFAKPRRMSCDDLRNVEIMRQTPLRKLPNNSVSGSSLNF